MSTWLNADAMILKHQVTKENLYVFSYNNKRSKYIKKEGKYIFFNDKELSRLKNIREKKWAAAHNYYYFLRDNVGLSDAAQAKLIIEDTKVGTYGTWVYFLSSGLWRAIERESVLAIKVERTYLQTYFNWCKKAIPKIKLNLE